jgi:uncharacterized membrane protein
MFFVFALLLGFVAGLRSMAAPAAAAWGAQLVWPDVAGTRLAFMGYRYNAIILTLLAAGELIIDKLPTTPSRKIPPAFITRIVMGSLAGATLGAGSGSLIGGLLAGAIGAVLGTYGGAAFRARLASTLGKDLPAALVEDVLAVVLSLVAVAKF